MTEPGDRHAPVSVIAMAELRSVGQLVLARDDRMARRLRSQHDEPDGDERRGSDEQRDERLRSTREIAHHEAKRINHSRQEDQAQERYRPFQPPNDSVEPPHTGH